MNNKPQKISAELLTEMQHMHKLMGVSPIILRGDVQIITEESKIGGISSMIDNILNILKRHDIDSINKQVDDAFNNDDFSKIIFKNMSLRDAIWKNIDDVEKLEKHVTGGGLGKEFKESFKSVFDDKGHTHKLLDVAFKNVNFDDSFNAMMETALISLKKTGEIPPSIESKYIDVVPGLKDKLVKFFKVGKGTEVELDSTTAGLMKAFFSSASNKKYAQGLLVRAGMDINKPGVKAIEFILTFFLWLTRGSVQQISKVWKTESGVDLIKSIGRVLYECLGKLFTACATATYIILGFEALTEFVKGLLGHAYETNKKLCKKTAQKVSVYCWIVWAVEEFTPIIDSWNKTKKDLSTISPEVADKIEELENGGKEIATEGQNFLTKTTVWKCKTYGGLTAKEKHQYQQWVAAGSDPATHKGCE